MNNYAKASGSKRRPHDDGDDERRRPRKGMDDRRREQLARLRQKVHTRRAIVKKEKGKEQRDEEVDEERPNKLPPTEEPPMPLASHSDFPSNHWVEPNEEALDLSPTYPDNCVSMMVPPLPPLSPPPSGLVIGAPRIPRIKCADDETLAARNARLARGERIGKRSRKVVEDIEEDNEEDEDQRDVEKMLRMGLRERYPRGAQSLEDHILIKTRVMDRMEARQERMESELARIARLLEARENEAKAGSEGEESKEKNDEDE
ncbi:hypothetical protein DFH05DRAFT_1460113 [Lentinula detonsa]|uniref:Uncharacterized protein n=1 Tax=Lentinula detonsa TaxID=2804962 RepID=A0A9W8TXB7_9AGAR|nr:hypothetical protein DFH05DRAFT_1460113 [Lentinula detonsa]